MHCEMWEGATVERGPKREMYRRKGVCNTTLATQPTKLSDKMTERMIIVCLK